MIDLDSPRWSELRDAYEPAGHIPAILRELETDEAAIWKLYDAFALIDRGAASEAAYAALPHLWRIAEPRAPIDRYHLVQLASRIAYCALGSASGMAPDIVADGDAALVQFLAAARALFGEVDEDYVLEVAEAVLALARCDRIHDAVESLDGGAVTIVCPGETCGVQIELQARDDQLVAVVDDLETDVELSPPPAYDPAAPWTDGDALPRLVEAIAAAGCADLAQQVALLGGSVICPQCGEELSVLHELLEPTEL
jgi:hypothetical protein